MLAKIKLVFMQNDILFTHTCKYMNQYIIKCSVHSKTVYNLEHV